MIRFKALIGSINLLELCSENEVTSMAKIAKRLWSEEKLTTHFITNGKHYRRELTDRKPFTDKEDLEKIDLVIIENYLAEILNIIILIFFL